tara:strand:+ start:113 stop:850 length:738 start_codon:yes stop_codon:yes gene_type:complete
MKNQPLIFAPIGVIAAGSFFLSSVKAEEENKFYVTASGGTSFFDGANSEKENYSINGTSASVGWELELEDEFGYDVGIGYDLGKTRLELSVSLQDTNVERTSLNATYSGTSAIVGVATKGDAEATSYLFSLNRDFPSDSGWTPYIGAGLGMTSITTNDVTIQTGTLGDALGVNLGTTAILKGSTAEVFAYQVKGGIAKSLSEKTELFGEVSYLGTEGHTAGSGDTEIKWKGINLIGTRIGFRYKF